MPGKMSKTLAKVAKKDAAKRVTAEPPLLSGGNPQIAKADVDAPRAGLHRGHAGLEKRLQP